MNNVVVLFTEVGGPAGISTIKSFRKTAGATLVCLDSNQLAAGLAMCDKPYVCPKAVDQDDYKDFLLDIISKEKVNFILPTGQYDLEILSELKGKIEPKIYVSDPMVIRNCKNKLLFYETYKSTLPLPKTYTHDFIQKPIFGVGSRNTSVIICNRNMIIQEFVEGTEYTIDIFYDDRGRCAKYVARERVEIKSGISVKSIVTNDGWVDDVVKKVSAIIPFIGPINVQVIKMKNGDVRIIEINPRLSGTSIVATLAGFNFAEYYLNLYKGIQPTYQPIKEITVVRYFEELIL